MFKNRMTLKKTYPKILLLIFSSSVFFILLYSSLYYYTRQLEKQVYRNSSKQFDNEVNELLELDGKPISVAINNDTNWDEFVKFITTRDSSWFNETITNEIDIYKADYFGVYDINKKFLIHSATAKIKSFNFIPKLAMDKLDKLGYDRFYMKIPEGIVEVFGASIHPSNDPLKNKTKPSGYFFVVRVLDVGFLKNLERLTNSEINFAAIGKENESDKHKIFATIELRDCQNRAVAELLFKRNFEVYFEKTINILYLIIIGFFVNLIVVLIYARRWVYGPLDLVARILETGNKKAIKLLKSSTGEFRHIGGLFEENSNQRKQLEKAKAKAEESDKLKSSFLTNLSHEIRTPMNAILGFTDLLKGKDLSLEERSEYLNIISKSGTNLVSIIDDLIEMSKIDANQIAPNYSNVNLESCLYELYETVKVTIPESRKIDFFIIENHNPATYNIVTDETKLKQIIINLITNAVKFTDKGFVSFGYLIDEENEIIKFTIKDSGLGIDKKKHQYIFDRFKRIDGDMSIKAGGLGLGLAISKAYVEMLGGVISLESNIGKGSIFSFSIPLKISKGDKKEIQPIYYIADDLETESGTILIAEDDNINFLLFKKIMQLKKHTIIRAVNGQEAVDICSNNSNIDLVLMDIKMPVMNGFEAFEKIQTFRPELPIIAQTAYSSTGDKKKIEQMGFFGYITKPINKEKLFDMIEKAFQVNKEKMIEH
jgi:signal transduction histidine kinase/CheY-like chemotaxis protein